MKYLILLLAIICAISCTTNTNIYLKKDGSTTVSTSYWQIEYLDDSMYPEFDTLKAKFLEREVVSNVTITADSFFILVDILTIDFAGNFMDTFNDGYFNFKYYQDSLLMMKSTEMAPFSKPDFKACCHLFMILTFEGKIKKVCSSNRQVKWKKKDNLVEVGLINKKMRKGKKPFELKVFF